MIINCVSYSFEINNSDRNLIKEKGFEIKESKKGELIIADKNSSFLYGINKDDFEKDLNIISQNKEFELISQDKFIDNDDESGKMIGRKYDYKNKENGYVYKFMGMDIIWGNHKKEIYIQSFMKPNLPNDYLNNNNFMMGVLLEKLAEELENDISNQVVKVSSNSEANNKEKVNSENKFSISGTFEALKDYKAKNISLLSKEIPHYSIYKDGNFLMNRETNKLADGIITYRGTDGKIYSQQGVNKGLLDGINEEYYYPSRKLKVKGKYKTGERHGDWIFKYENGNDKEKISYDNGVEDGSYKKWYLNKKVEVEGKYKNAEKTGTWTYYHENGKIKEKGDYKNGEKVRVWKTYNSNGKVQSERRHSFF